MKKSVWHIKIPTYLGLLSLLCIVMLTIFLIGTDTFSFIRANQTQTPASIRISNINDTSFTVSFITAASATTSLSYGETNETGIIVYDDRDKTSNTPIPRQVHYISVNGLKPQTQYYFSILSEGTLYNEQGRPYTVTTGPVLKNETSDQRIVQGTVQTSNGSIPSEAIVYLQIENSQVLSTPVQKDGSYRFNLDNLRTNDLNNISALSENDSVNLSFFGDGYEATATITVKDAAQVPSVTLSNQYTFTVTEPTETVTDTEQRIPLPQFIEETPATEVEVQIPEENQSFSDDQPEFAGKALPNSQVTITIKSEKQITTTVQSNASGNWSYRPTETLEPGNHTITVSGRNAQGILQTITRSFVVYAEGSQFTEPSVEPATPTPQLTIKPTAAPTNTALPTATVTTLPTPTAIAVTPTTVPQLTPFPTSQILPTATIAPPGGNEIIISAGLIMFATLISAMVFFFIRV
jgi:hypothetical protein